MSNLGKKINPLELISREGFALSQIPALAGINVALSLISLNPALMVSFAAGSGAFLALQIRRKQIWREAIRAGKLIEEIQRAAERYLRHLSIINTNLTKGIPIKESLAVVAKDINSLKSDFDRLIAEWNSLNNSSARKKARINKVANRDQLQNNRAFLPKDAQLILNLEALSAQVLAAQTKISSAELEKEKITNPSKFYRDKLQTLEGKVTNSASPEEPKNLKDQISKLREEITAVSKFPIYANTAESQGLAGIISSSLLSDETVLRKILELEAKTKSAERLEEYKKKIREFRVKVLHFATLSKDEQDEKSSHIIDEYLELVRYLKIFSTDRQEGLLYSDQMDLKTYFNEQIQNDVFKTYLEPFLTSSDGTSTEASSSRLEIPTSKSVGAQVGEQQQTQETEFNPETAKTIVEKLLKQWSEIDGIDYLQNDEQIKWAWFWGVYEKLSTGDTRTSVERKVSEWAKNDGYLDGKYPEEQKQNMQLGEATRQVINAMLLNQQKINEGKQSSDEEVALRVTPVSTASSASVPPPPPPPPPPPSSRNQDTKPLSKIMALLASKFLPLDDDLNNSASEAESASEGKKGPRFWPNLRFRKSENLEKKITPKNIMQFIKRLAENHKALFSSMNPQIIPGAEEISSMEVEQTLSEKDVVAQLKLIDKLISWLRSKRGSSMEKKSQARLETVLDTLINEATTFVRLAYVPYMKTNTNKTYFEQILQKYQELLNILNNGDSTSREESTPVTTPAAIESSTQPAQGSAQNKSSAPENVTETLASSRTKILPTTPSEPEVPQSLAPDQPIEEDEQITKITNENFARMVGRLETKLLLLVPDDQNPHISETDITWLDNCITQFIIFFNSYPSNALSSFQRDFFWTIINDHIKILTNILRTAQLSPTINQKIEKLKRNYEDLKKIIESKPGVEAQKQSNDA